MVSNIGKKRIYTVRRSFRISATIGMICLLLLYGLLVMYILYKATGRFAQQIVQISAIKNFEIKSKTISELKQRELSLNNLALYSAAQSISSLISNPQNMEEGYL